MRRLLLVAGWLALAHPAAGWRVTWRGVGNALALDTDGGVVVAGSHPGRFPIPSFDVERLTGSGRRRWRFRGALGGAEAVAVDPAGDVVVGGFVREGSVDSPTTLTVLKLDRRRGRELWRAQPSLGEVRSLAITSAGDVIAAGINDLQYLTVARLAGATGAVQWQKTLTGGLEVLETRVAVDGADGVVACGGLVVWSLAGDGTERWRVTLPGLGEETRSLALGPGGDAFVTLGDGFTVLRLAAVDGSERWRATLARYGLAVSVVLDQAGDVLAGGNLGGTGGAVFGVAKLDGATGAERWRGTVGVGGVHALAVDGEGNVVATGRTTGTGSGAVPTFAIASLAGDTGVVRWRRFLDRTSRKSTDSGAAVVIDRGGHAIAIGTIGPLDEEHAVVVRVSRR